MSDNHRDQQFRQIIDSFIHLANEHIDSVDRERVSMALLYAAARFGAFVAASRANDVYTYDAERPTAVEFFSGEYVRMLNENLDDYRLVYDAPGRYAHLMAKQ